jgi:hypothetical protein
LRRFLVFAAGYEGKEENKAEPEMRKREETQRLTLTSSRVTERHVRCGVDLRNKASRPYQVLGKTILLCSERMQ